MVIPEYVEAKNKRDLLFPVSEERRFKGIWHDGIFVWRIILPPPLSMGWRWRNEERSGWEPFEWDIVLKCSELRHSTHISTCRVCGYRHERPSTTPERYAFYWYPLEPSIQSLQQWERRRREKEMAGLL